MFVILRNPDNIYLKKFYIKGHKFFFNINNYNFMLAQKSPIVSLILNLNDSWNSLYFQEITNFKTQLIEDYQLRFLILNYLNKRYYWLRRLVVKKHNGLFFINIDCISAQPQKNFIPLFIKITKSPIPSISQLQNDLIKNNLNNQIFFFKDLVHRKTLLKWTHGLKNSDIINKLQPNILNTDYCLEFLLKYTKKMQIKLYIKYSPILGLYKKKKIVQLKNKKIKQIFFKKSNNPLTPSNTQRSFSTIEFNLSQKVVQDKFFFGTSVDNQVTHFQIKKNPLNFLKMLKITNKVIAKKKIQKTKKQLYLTYKKKKKVIKTNLYIIPRKWYIFVRNILKKFFFKKKKTWRGIIRTWIKKWGHKLRFRKNINRRFIVFAHTKITAERIIHTSCYFNFNTVYWKLDAYDAIKDFVIFESCQGKKFFNQLIAATHFTLSQGAPAILIDYLRINLHQQIKHIPILSALENSIKYWLCYIDSTRILSNVLCHGVKIEVIGKIDGSSRTRTWSILVGANPTSTFNANIRYEQTIIPTRYGILHVHVWLYFLNNKLII